MVDCWMCIKLATGLLYNKHELFFYFYCKKIFILFLFSKLNMFL